jgi:hypothetical protein
MRPPQVHGPAPFPQLPPLPSPFPRVLSSALTAHYLHHLLISLKPKEFLYYSMKARLLEFHQAVSADVAQLVKEHPQFIGEQLWAMVGSRSRARAGAALAIVGAMMLGGVGGGRELLVGGGGAWARQRRGGGDQQQARSSSTTSSSSSSSASTVPSASSADGCGTIAQFVEALRDLSGSRHAHVIAAASRIFAAAAADPDWSAAVLANYAGSQTAVTQDMIDLPCQRAAAGSTAVPARTAELLRFMEGILANASAASQISALVSNQIFTHLLKRLVSRRPDASTPGLAPAARLLAAFARAYTRLGVLNVGDVSIVKSKKVMARLETTAVVLRVEVQITDILGLMSFAGAVPPDSHAATTSLRADAVACLAALLKTPSSFALIRNEKAFFDKLLELCRSDADPALNRVAWRVVFQLIRVHGAAEDLDRAGRLRPFLEVAGPACREHVLSNALHYMRKMLTLAEGEAARVAAGKAPVPDAVRKGYAKASERVASVFRRNHMFIRTHMAFKRVCFRRGRGEIEITGRASIELAHFYHTIMTAPAAAKLAKELSKNPEFLIGLRTLTTLVAREDPNSTPSSKKGKK